MELNVLTETISGLSPRVRGNRVVGKGECGVVGSIPACAGEPNSESRQMGMDLVYPRVCGGTTRRNSS